MKRVWISLSARHRKQFKTCSRLPELREFALDLETGLMYMSDDEGEWGHPAAMNGKDLVSPSHTSSSLLLNILLAFLLIDIRAGTSSRELTTLRHQAIRSRSLPLPEELLESLPEIPRSVEYLRWDTQEKKLLYRLERSEGKTKAVKCDPVRASSVAEELWAENRILDY